MLILSGLLFPDFPVEVNQIRDAHAHPLGNLAQVLKASVALPALDVAYICLAQSDHQLAIDGDDVVHSNSAAGTTTEQVQTGTEQKWVQDSAADRDGRHGDVPLLRLRRDEVGSTTRQEAVSWGAAPRFFGSRKCPALDSIIKRQPYETSRRFPAHTSLASE